METYPEMNETIKDLLKMNTESNVHQYAYQRIVELEAKVERYEKALKEMEDIALFCNNSVIYKMAKESLK